MEKCDYAVVGAGIEGSWTALQLVRRLPSARVLLLEQFPLPHSRGSSHGQTRIIRHAYAETYHADLMPRAFEDWRELEKITNQQLLIPTPLLCVAGDSSGYGPLDATLASLRRVLPGGEGSKFRQLNSAQLRTEFPQTSYTDKHRGVIEECAGILLADRCLAAVQSEFTRLGGTLRDGCRVLSIQPGRSAVLNCSQRRDGQDKELTISADRVAVCAGPWASKLLDPLLPIKLPLTPLRVNVYYWRIQDGGPGAIKTSYIDLGEKGEYWGIPECEYPGMVKYLHPTDLSVDPELRDAEARTRDLENQELNQLTAHIRRNFPGVDASAPALVETCMYTMTPDHTSILDHLPQHPNIVYACGFSGTGFKKAPSIGRIMVQLLNPETEKSFDTTPFALKRFIKS